MSAGRGPGAGADRQPEAEPVPAVLDPFDRYLLTVTYGSKLLHAAEALTVAALDPAAPAEALLARQALAALAPIEGLRAWPWYPRTTTDTNVKVKPVEAVAADIADVMVQAVLEADRPRRLRLGALLAAVAREAAEGRAAARVAA